MSQIQAVTDEEVASLKNAIATASRDNWWSSHTVGKLIARIEQEQAKKVALVRAVRDLAVDAEGVDPYVADRALAEFNLDLDDASEALLRAAEQGNAVAGLVGYQWSEGSRPLVDVVRDALQPTAPTVPAEVDGPEQTRPSHADGETGPCAADACNYPSCFVNGVCQGPVPADA